MSELLIFILGALFCLSLLAAVVALLPASSVNVPATAGVAATLPNFESRRSTRRPATPRRPANGKGYRQLPPPSKAFAAGDAEHKKEREAYRLMASLDRVEAVLVQISKLQEPAAAKIAGQTLKRMRSGDAPAPARLAFALNRLELLSLSPEPMARVAARRVLNSFA